jgi:5-methylcytosine-specific restriction endonuclease McrA
MKYDKRLRDIVFNKYNGHCAYCGVKLKPYFHIDHINPIYRGWSNNELEKYKIDRGKDNLENYNPCCPSCNSSKSTLSIEKWRVEIDKKYDRLLRDQSSFALLTRLGIIKKVSNCTFYFEKNGRE